MRDLPQQPQTNNMHPMPAPASLYPDSERLAVRRVRNGSRGSSHDPAGECNQEECFDSGDRAEAGSGMGGEA